MASNLRVDNIQPSTAMGIGIGTANGSVTFNADVTGGLNVTSGSVGVGTDNPNAAKLDVRGSDNPLLKLTQTTSGIARLNIESETNDGYQYSGIGIGSATADAELMWTTLGFDVNVADSVRLRIPSSGDVQVLTGNLVIGTSGKGIDFSATADGSGTTTSELLDDYEEGTWTPDLRFAGSNTGVSYAWRNGHYTKIGRQVTVRGAFGLSSRGTFTATDDAFIYGLPFDVAPYDITGGFHYMFGAAYNGYQGLFQLELQHSSSFRDHVPLSRQTAWNSAVSPMEYQDIGGSQRMAFTFSYFTAS